jgi:hypothetical protein
MQHRTLEQLKDIATIHPSHGREMTRAERLDRWAELLEQRGGWVRALRGVEFVPWRERQTAREDDSALSVAFADPVLRAAGLAGDRYQDGVAFFALRDDEAHFILCSCHAGDTPSAKAVATRIRHAAKGQSEAMLMLGLPLLVTTALGVGSLPASLCPTAAPAPPGAGALRRCCRRRRHRRAAPRRWWRGLRRGGVDHQVGGLFRGRGALDDGARVRDGAPWGAAPRASRSPHPPPLPQAGEGKNRKRHQRVTFLFCT